MSEDDIVDFRDAVAEDVAKQYPSVDYLAQQIRLAIEQRLPLLGWEWARNGPRYVEVKRKDGAGGTKK